MRIINRVKLAIAMLVACGCGASEGDLGDMIGPLGYQRNEEGTLIEIVDTRVLGGNEWAPTAERQPREIGQALQAFSGKFTELYQTGVTNSAARSACNRVDTFQQCLVPSLGATKDVRYYIDELSLGEPGEPTYEEVLGTIEFIDDATSGWSWTQVFTEAEAEVVFNNLLCAGSATSTQIQSYSCMNPTVSSGTLTVFGGAVGTYKAFTHLVGHLDMLDIAAHEPGGEGNINRLYLVSHATGHIVDAVMGLGGRSDVDAEPFFSRALITPDMGLFALSQGETCRANAYVATGGTTYAQLSPQCSGAN